MQIEHDDDPTRFTHFEPLTPNIDDRQSRSGVFNFIGKLFRNETETPSLEKISILSIIPNSDCETSTFPTANCETLRNSTEIRFDHADVDFSTEESEMRAVFSSTGEKSAGNDKFSIYSNSKSVRNAENTCENSSIIQTSLSTFDSDSSHSGESRSNTFPSPLSRFSHMAAKFSSIFRRSTAISNNDGHGLIDYNRSDFRQYWMPDWRGKQCYECHDRFTAFKRRHHCRICGQIFCAKCCNMQVSGTVLGYIGDLRLCTYCSKSVTNYLSCDNQTEQSISTQDTPTNETKDDDESEHSPTLSNISTVSACLYWSKFADIESNSLELSNKNGDKTSKMLSVHDIAVDFGDNMQTGDEFEPDWVKSIDMPDRPTFIRNNSIATNDVGREKSATLSSLARPWPALRLPHSGPRKLSLPPAHSLLLSPSSHVAPLRHSGDTLSGLFDSQALHLLDFLLVRSSLPQSAWREMLWQLARQVAHTVRPSVRVRRDHPDILSYVHVKCLPTRGPGLAPRVRLVHGAVCSKSATDRRMSVDLHRPSVLLIQGGIEYERVGGKFSSIEPMIMQETEYLKNVVARILAHHPSIIVVEKTVAHVALGFLKQAGVVVVCNVKSAVLKRIARATQADVIPSVDGPLLLQSPNLGECGSFRSETHRLPNDDRKNLLFFDDCAPDLCCSVLLYCDEKRQLMKAKKVLRLLVSVLYSAKLEMALLQMQNVCICEKECQEDCIVCMLNDDDSVSANQSSQDPFSLSSVLSTSVLSSSPFLTFGLPFLETERGRHCHLKSYFKQPLYRFDNDKNDDSDSPRVPRQLKVAGSRHAFVQQSLTDWDGAGLAKFRAEGGRLFRRQFEKAVEQQGRPAIIRRRAVSPVAKRHTHSSGCLNVLDPWEHQRIAVLFGSYSAKSPNAPLFCVRPWLVWMQFYGLHDMCLGEFLFKYCFNKDYQCPSSNCDIAMTDHVRKLVHRRVSIEITIQIMADGELNTDVDKLEDNDGDQILAWDWCSK